MSFYDLKKQVYDTALEIYSSKLVTGTWGNVSARTEDNHLIITPSGMDYKTLTPADMIVVDMMGQVVEGKFKPSIETPMHIAIYQQRPDVKAVVHVHSPYATAFAVAHKPIPVILEETAQVIGHPVKVADYAICGSDELAQKVTRCITDNERAVLGNHGLVALGRDLKEALKICFYSRENSHDCNICNSTGRSKELIWKKTRILNQKFASYGQQK